MTPVRQDPRQFRHPTVLLAGAVLGVLLLVLLLLPARDPATHALSIEWRPTAPLAFLLFLAAVAGAARPQMITTPASARILGGLVTALALLNLVDMATPTLLGRDLKILRSHIGVGALETSHARPIPPIAYASDDITRAFG